MHHSAVPRYSKHQHSVKKGKSIVHLTQDELESGSGSEQIIVGLVMCHVLAVECNEANSWIVDSGAPCHICCNK